MVAPYPPSCQLGSASKNLMHHLKYTLSSKKHTKHGPVNFFSWKGGKYIYRNKKIKHKSQQTIHKVRTSCPNTLEEIQKCLQNVYLSSLSVSNNGTNLYAKSRQKYLFEKKKSLSLLPSGNPLHLTFPFWRIMLMKTSSTATSVTDSRGFDGLLLLIKKSSTNHWLKNLLQQATKTHS